VSPYVPVNRKPNDAPGRTYLVAELRIYFFNLVYDWLIRETGRVA